MSIFDLKRTDPNAAGHASTGPASAPRLHGLDAALPEQDVRRRLLPTGPFGARRGARRARASSESGAARLPGAGATACPEEGSSGARRFATLTMIWLLVTLAAGCRQDMHDQPSYSALEKSSFFADGRSARQPVSGTVARGHLDEDAHLMTGRINGQFVTEFPFPVKMETMRRGQERYEIFCSPCHDRLGTGRGMVVRRGFPQAASFHIDRLRQVEVGYLFDVASKGFGRMSGYAAQIPVADRWAIVAYLRALQLSQHASASDLPPGGLPATGTETTAR